MKRILYLISLICLPLFVLAQQAAQPVSPSLPTDSISVPADSISLSSDSLSLRADTLPVLPDTVPVVPDSVTVRPDKGNKPLKSDLNKAKEEVLQAKKEMREAKEEVKQVKTEIRKTRRVLQWKNELRFGWGDQLFETLMWHQPTSVITTMPTTWTKTYHENFSYNQHLWIEYQYYFAYWFSLGGMVDLSEVGWTDVTRNGVGIDTEISDRKYFYNAVVMPTIRFTYISHPNVHLYSGLGFGFDINGGTEKNMRGNKTDVGLAVNLTLIGVSADFSRCFFSFDFGGMVALRDKNTIFMALSRMMSVGFGVRF